VRSTQVDRWASPACVTQVGGAGSNLWGRYRSKGDPRPRTFILGFHVARVANNLPVLRGSLAT